MLKKKPIPRPKEEDLTPTQLRTKYRVMIQNKLNSMESLLLAPPLVSICVLFDHLLSISNSSYLFLSDLPQFFSNVE